MSMNIFLVKCGTRREELKNGELLSDLEQKRINTFYAFKIPRRFCVASIRAN